MNNKLLIAVKLFAAFYRTYTWIGCVYIKEANWKGTAVFMYWYVREAIQNKLFNDIHSCLSCMLGEQRKAICVYFAWECSRPSYHLKINIHINRTHKCSIPLSSDLLFHKPIQAYHLFFLNALLLCIHRFVFNENTIFNGRFYLFWVQRSTQNKHHINFHYTFFFVFFFWNNFMIENLFSKNIHDAYVRKSFKNNISK